MLEVNQLYSRALAHSHPSLHRYLKVSPIFKSLLPILSRNASHLPSLLLFLPSSSSSLYVSRYRISFSRSPPSASRAMQGRAVFEMGSL